MSSGDDDYGNPQRRIDHLERTIDSLTRQLAAERERAERFCRAASPARVGLKVAIKRLESNHTNDGLIFARAALHSLERIDFPTYTQAEMDAAMAELSNPEPPDTGAKNA